MIAYIENLIDPIKKLFDLISEFGKTMRYNINIQISMTFLYSKNEISKQESKFGLEENKNSVTMKKKKRN